MSNFLGDWLSYSAEPGSHLVAYSLNALPWTADLPARGCSTAPGP